MSKSRETNPPAGTNLAPREKPDLRVVVCAAAGADSSYVTPSLWSDVAPDVVIATDLDALFRSHDRQALDLDVAVVIVDATRALESSIRRECYLISLLRVPQIVTVVACPDAAAETPAAFAAMGEQLREFAGRIDLKIDAIVAVAPRADGNTQASCTRPPWYQGRTLREVCQASNAAANAKFRLIVEEEPSNQSVAGRLVGAVTSGHVQRGDLVRVWPSGEESRVIRLIHEDSEITEAGPGGPIRLDLEPAVGVRRGDVVTAVDAPPQIGRQFEAVVVWQHAQAMLPGRSYLLQVGAREEPATVTPLKFKIDLESFQQLAAQRLEAGEIGTCEVEFDHPIVFEPFSENRTLGRFAALDRLTREPIGAGFLRFALHRSDTVHWQALEVSKAVRVQQKRHRACIIWLTGLSGAGKSTIANLVEKKLVALGCHTYLLDGDNVRHGLNKDLGFTAQDRVENIRRVAEVAKLMVDAGLVVLVSFISPFRAERRMARDLVEPGEMIEVFVDTPLAVAEERDPKGLYKRARKGELKNFTGIDSPYEVPLNPEIHIDTTTTASTAAAEQVIAYLVNAGVVRAAAV